MENKKPEIVAPEGYELDKENSTLEKIVFIKKKDNKPKTWEEFCRRGFTGEEVYIYTTGVSKSSYKKGSHRGVTEVGYVDNAQEAQAFVALMQLRQLRKAWVGNWEPDWSNDKSKYCIVCYFKNIKVLERFNASNPLSFSTEEMAEEFVKCFKNLIEQAKMLL